MITNHFRKIVCLWSACVERTITFKIFVIRIYVSFFVVFDYCREGKEKNRHFIKNRLRANQFNCHGYLRRFELWCDHSKRHETYLKMSSFQLLSIFCLKKKNKSQWSRVDERKLIWLVHSAQLEKYELQF